MTKEQQNVFFIWGFPQEISFLGPFFLSFFYLFVLSLQVLIKTNLLFMSSTKNIKNKFTVFPFIWEKEVLTWLFESDDKHLLFSASRCTKQNKIVKARISTRLELIMWELVRCSLFDVMKWFTTWAKRQFLVMSILTGSLTFLALY